MNEKWRVIRTIVELYDNCRGNRLINGETRRRYGYNGGTLEANEFFQMLRELERDGLIDRDEGGFYVK